MGGIAGQAGLGAFPDELIGGIPQLDGTRADIQRHLSLIHISKNRPLLAVVANSGLIVMRFCFYPAHQTAAGSAGLSA